MKKILLIAVFIFTAMSFVNINAVNLEKSTSLTQMAEGGLTCLEAVAAYDEACGGISYEVFLDLVEHCEAQQQ